MLRITIEDKSEAITLKLKGRLAGPWVQESKKLWIDIVSQLGDKRLIVDTSSLRFVDSAGKYLLTLIRKEGAILSGSGSVTRELIGESPELCSPSKQCKVRRRKRMGGMLPLLLILCFSLPRSAQCTSETVTLTLEQAVRTALQQNPQTRIANLKIAEAQERSHVQRASLLPQVSLKSSDTLIRENVATILGVYPPILPHHLGPFNDIQAGAQFSMPIFDLTLWKRWKASKQDVAASNGEMVEQREEIALLVVSQYLGALRSHADVKAANSRVELAKALYKLATDMQTNGVGTSIDTLRANVQFQNEQQRLITARTELQTSLYGLVKLLNLDPQQPVQLADAESFFQTPVYPAQATVAEAFAQRPELRAVASQIRAAELEKNGARDERLPRVEVGGNWSMAGITPSSMVPTYEYHVGLDVPLFIGGRIKAEIAGADIQIRKLEQTKQDFKNEIALQVKDALARLDSARKQVDVANLGVQLAQEEVQQAQDRFRAGVANNIEVSTAQDELARANDNQIGALYNYNQSRADLAHATGQIESMYAR